MELKCFLQKQLQKKHAFSNIIQKAVDNNLSEENTEHLICDRSNYSVKIFTAHPSPTWPTSLLHDPPHPFMNQPTPTQHDPPHPTPPQHYPWHLFMTHPPLHDLWHPFMTHPTPPQHDLWHPFMNHLPLHYPWHPFMMNVNWEKFQSIILSVPCHGLRNFPLLIHIPSNPFVNFWNPMSYYFLS